MGHEERSSTEDGDDREETVDSAVTEETERQAEAAVNPAVALRLLGDTGDGDTDEASARDRRDDAS